MTRPFIGILDARDRRDKTTLGALASPQDLAFAAGEYEAYLDALPTGRAPNATEAQRIRDRAAARARGERTDARQDEREALDQMARGFRAPHRKG